MLIIMMRSRLCNTFNYCDMQRESNSAARFFSAPLVVADINVEMVWSGRRICFLLTGVKLTSRMVKIKMIIRGRPNLIYDSRGTGQAFSGRDGSVRGRTKIMIMLIILWCINYEFHSIILLPHRTPAFEYLAVRLFNSSPAPQTLFHSFSLSLNYLG